MDNATFIQNALKSAQASLDELVKPEHPCDFELVNVLVQLNAVVVELAKANGLADETQS